MIQALGNQTQVIQDQRFLLKIGNPFQWLNKKIEELTKTIALTGGVVGTIVTLAAIVFSSVPIICGSAFITGACFISYYGLRQDENLKSKGELNQTHTKLNRQEAQLNRQERALLKKKGHQIEVFEQENGKLKKQVKALGQAEKKVEEYKKTLQKLQQRDRATQALYHKVKKQSEALKNKYAEVEQDEQEAVQAVGVLKEQVQVLKEEMGAIQEARKTFRTDRKSFKQALKENEKTFNAAIHKIEIENQKIGDKGKHLGELGDLLSKNHEDIQKETEQAKKLAKDLKLHDDQVEANLKTTLEQNEAFIKDARALWKEIQGQDANYADLNQQGKDLLTIIV